MKKILVIVGLFCVATIGISAKSAGTVNGMVITVAEANKALKTVTKGQMTWAKLPIKERKQLLQMIAPSKLVAVAARKTLNSKEKRAALSAFWMQKKVSKIKISDALAKKEYIKMKKRLQKTKGKRKIPTFNQAKPAIKLQLAQERIVNKMMKKAKIRLK